MKSVGKTPTGAGDGSWGDGVRCEGVRWCTAGGAMTQVGVNEVSRRRLLELAMAAGVMGCVGARLMEL